MNDVKLLTELSGSMLAESFPSNHSVAAIRAGEAMSCLLASRQQWTDRFTVQVEGERVLIPTRLRFTSKAPAIAENDGAWQFVRALQSRSGDGFERQRAARDLLTEIQPWAAPFIVALIGEYVVEILDDIAASLTSENERTLAAFVVQNEAYWNKTKRRVASYWDVYYRSTHSGEMRRTYRRDEYVGFKLIDRLETAASGSL